MALGSSSLHEIVYVIMASRGVIGFAVGMAMPAAQIYVRNGMTRELKQLLINEIIDVKLIQIGV